MSLARVAFWVSLAGLLHTWGVYTAAMLLLSRHLKGRSREDGREILPSYSVSFIIAARNEEAHIFRRIQNLAHISVGLREVEVIVASDGSTDGTCEEVLRAKEIWPFVTLLHFPQHVGRAILHNEAAKRSRGEILIFTDAQTEFHPDFLKIALSHFEDPKVGAVSGRIAYINQDQSSVTVSAGLYWRIEERIRDGESKLGILAFGTGAAFCMRRELYFPMQSPNDDVDYWETLSLVGRGFRVHYEPEAYAYDVIAPDLSGTHKVRAKRTAMALRSMVDGLFRFELWKRPGVLFCLFSHKLLRHFSPFLLLVLLAANILLVSKDAVYEVGLVGQGIFYSMAAMGFLCHKRHWNWRPFVIPFNFVLLNWSRLLGVVEGMLSKPPSSYT